ncbi:MAG: MG2 domain-containing protein [Terracidiphilus sp.]
MEVLADDSNEVVDQAAKDLQIAPGTLVETLQLGQKPLYHNPTGFGGHRLRYTVRPQQSGDFEPVQGIIQLGPHIVDGFEIQGYPSSHFHCPLDCRFLVRVAEPNSGRGLAGYDVKSDFCGNPDTTIHAITDKDGYAEIRYDLPADRADLDGMMQVRVSRGPYETGWGGELFRRAPPHLTLTTDKPTFQPGEMVHTHIMLTGTDRKPWSGGNITLTITDVYKDRELLREKLVTSPSGEASEDWTIPEDMKDGTLSIFVTSDDEPQGNWTAKNKARIQIEKVVQPAFLVDAVPDQPYYLPGQNAKLRVSGAELSGVPIRNGKVSVETGAYAPAKLQGGLDDSGEYVPLIDLKGMWDWLKESGAPWWPSPHSFDFPVYVLLTDSSTGRTESRNVVLHLAQQEIHLYIDDRQAVGSEKTFGIISSYVDKSPASVDGVVEATIPDVDGKCVPEPDAAHRLSLGSFHTNAYGVARFTLPQSWIHYAYPQREDGPYSWYSRVRRWDTSNEQATKRTCILLRASDGNGKTGTLFHEVAVVRESHFATRISADHAIYRPGNPVQVRIESDAGLAEALVEIRAQEQELVGAQHARLTDGRADLTFPYNPQFRGLLTVHVYAITGADDANPVDSWSQEIIYPAGEGLKTGERWPTEIWTPDQAQPDNRRFMRMLGEEDHGRLAGIEKTDLLRLDPGKPFPEGMDLVAWALLGPPQAWGGWWVGYYRFRHEEFDKENLAQIEPAVKKLYAQTGKFPKTEKELIEELKEADIDFPSLRDGWGMPYRALFGERVIYLVSNGPDKIPDTNDDYLAEKIQQP